MKLTKVLLPEVVKKSRSSGNLSTDKIFELALESIHFTDEGVDVTESGLDFNTDDNNVYLSCFAHAKRHMIDKAHTYHLCKDFGEALLNLKEREIIEEFLPKEFFAYISLPKNLIADVQGAYIYIGKSDKKTPFLKKLWGKKIVWISFFGEFRDDGNFPMNKLSFYFDDGKTISEILDHYGHDQASYGELDLNKLGNLLLNCVLYLNSQDPELLDLKPTFKASHSKQKSNTINGHTNCCSIPVKAINWDYKKSKNYQDSTIFVDGFLAWRRCGPNHSQIRLSWISEHEKTIKKTIKD